MVNPLDLAFNNLAERREQGQINTAQRAKKAVRNPTATRYQGFNSAQGKPLTSAGIGGKIKTNGLIERGTQMQRIGDNFNQMPHKKRKTESEEKREGFAGKIKILFSVEKDDKTIFYIGGDRKTSKKLLEVKTSEILTAQLENLGRSKNAFEAGVLTRILVPDGGGYDYTLNQFKGSQTKKTQSHGSLESIRGLNGKFWRFEVLDIIRYENWNDAPLTETGYTINQGEDRYTTNTYTLMSFNYEMTIVNEDKFYRKLDAVGIKDSSDTIISYHENLVINSEYILNLFVDINNVVQNKTIYDIYSDLEYTISEGEIESTNRTYTVSGISDFTNFGGMFDINGVNTIERRSNRVVENAVAISESSYEWQPSQPEPYESDLYFNDIKIPEINNNLTGGRHIYDESKNNISFYKPRKTNSEDMFIVDVYSLKVGDSGWESSSFEEKIYPITKLTDSNKRKIWVSRYFP